MISVAFFIVIANLYFKHLVLHLMRYSITTVVLSSKKEEIGEGIDM